jgi:hypothetical protein
VRPPKQPPPDGRTGQPGQQGDNGVSGSSQYWRVIPPTEIVVAPQGTVKDGEG